MMLFALHSQTSALLEWLIMEEVWVKSGTTFQPTWSISTFSSIRAETEPKLALATLHDYNIWQLYLRLRALPPHSTLACAKTMGLANYWLVATVLVLSGAVYSAFVQRRQLLKGNFPPGPKPRPIIGNVLDILTAEPWQTYINWEKEYQSAYTILNL